MIVLYAVSECLDWLDRSIFGHHSDLFCRLCQSVREWTMGPED